jgi:hypothetical protein
MTRRDGFVLVPLVLAILAIALYPQFALHRSEKTVGALSATPNAQSATAVKTPLQIRRTP